MASAPFSKLQTARQAYTPALPRALSAPRSAVALGDVPVPATDADKLAALFPATFGRAIAHITAAAEGTPGVAAPLRVGCVLSGGQAPGGHNVIAGLYDYIRRAHPGSELYGFLDGPRGLMTGQYVLVDDALMDRYRNMGGFDMIGR
jgi:pyrophosphate--fructose-6-phosphate 1-phosphotransferase